MRSFLNKIFTKGEFEERTVADDVADAARLHGDAIEMMERSRQCLKSIYPYAIDGEDAVCQQSLLNEKIHEVLGRYKADESVYKYFYGQPYQGLAIAGVFGDRVCDYRFDDYELGDHISSTDTVLDIGCNCGYMAILASYRTGCSSYGVDINPYMIQIGQLVANYLRVSKLVHLEAGDLLRYSPGIRFDKVMSFATHWTDDENYRVGVEDHMKRMASLLKSGGKLIFETHCNDMTDQRFCEAMEESKSLFDFDGPHKKTDSGTRELYIMVKR